MHKSSQAHDPISVLLYNVPPFLITKKCRETTKKIYRIATLCVSIYLLMNDSFHTLVSGVEGEIN